MTSYDRWDVITALFPFTEIAVRKPRPVLVLSAEGFNQSHNHVVGAMITTGAGSFWPSDYHICDLHSAGLSHPSVIRWKIFTLPGDLIGRKVGELAVAERDPVVKLTRQLVPAGIEG